ncbi:hypothetical protein EZS27_038252 [termite gut metagenome]|uniref:site-specific DNA-methyltransferase (adenine-specific) n=1 Tax=termite gut metagenome TaxID=433724 RepID=A0A5J4PQ56_9ZZZZ
MRPILRGRDIKRYGYDFADLWLINTHNGIKEKGVKAIDVNDYPAIKNHLDKYYPQLEKRVDKGGTPHNLRNCAYMEDFYKQKILYSEITQGSCFIFDEKAKYFMLQTGYIIIGDNLKYLLSLLNSKFIEWSFRKFYSIELGSSGLRWLKQYVENLPIPKPNKAIEQTIEQLLENKNYKNIDKLVYEMYDLTDDEIEVIENL